ncbi:MAG: cytochrome C oxidase subunit IV family protein [Gammaproteobacteria bacterium]|nr:cytochrome C oxidase subunit IV family protein [Gammaproteobacteria bacterium]
MSSRRLIRPCTWVYLALMLLTLLTWAIGRLGMGGLWLSLFVLLLALIKGGLIGDWFMGLRQVRGLWRWVVVVWLLLPGALIAAAFLLSYRG